MEPIAICDGHFTICVGHALQRIRLIVAPISGSGGKGGDGRILEQVLLHRLCVSDRRLDRRPIPSDHLIVVVCLKVMARLPDTLIAATSSVVQMEPVALRLRQKTIG